MQGALPAGAALVEFVRHRPFNARATRNADRWGAERYVAFVLRPTGGPAWVDVGDADFVDGQVMRFRAALRRPPDPVSSGHAFAGSMAAMKRAARALDAQVMQPVRRLLGRARHLFVVPDGQLNLIPFSALVSERGDFLLGRYSITYLSSGRDLLRSQENRPRPNSPPAVFAHPAFDGPSAAPADDGGEGCSRVNNQTRADAPRQDTGAAAPPAANDGAAARDFNAPTFDLGTIGNTLSEARDICALLPEARLFTDGRATESALKRVQSPRILHVATHGFVRPDRVHDAVESQTTWLDLAAYDPAFSPAKEEPPVEDVLTRSGLALANANLLGDNLSGQDGVLTALEASGLNLWGTRLVVLSACSTGLGDIRNGEGFFGLRRALFVAGAESQLISLWSVNDAATRRLMVRFYTLLLRQRQGRLESLRRAQLDMASGRGAWAHPYYWAGFVMSGEWVGLEDGAQQRAAGRRRRGR